MQLLAEPPPPGWLVFQSDLLVFGSTPLPGGSSKKSLKSPSAKRYDVRAFDFSSATRGRPAVLGAVEHVVPHAVPGPKSQANLCAPTAVCLLSAFFLPLLLGYGLSRSEFI